MDTVKHSFGRWSLLPANIKELIKNYKKICPAGAKYFFVQKDGRPLRRNHVVDMLDICNLQMSARNLRILPHGLHSGEQARDVWTAPKSWKSIMMAIGVKQAEPLITTTKVRKGMMYCT